MSALLETSNPDRAGIVFGSVALPFEAPREFSVRHGGTIEEILEGLFERGMIERAWTPRLRIFVDDIEFMAPMWPHVRPRPGRLVAVRAQAGEPVSISTFLINLALNIAVTVAVSAVISAFVGAGPSAQSFEQLADIDASRNEFAPFRKVPVVLGTFRTFPPHAAKAYTEGIDEKVFVRMLFCWGVGPVELSDLKIGDTPITEFDGVVVQHKLKPGDPWPGLFPSSADEEDGPGLIAFADDWVARMTTSSECEELQVELAFPEGLVFYSSDGSVKTFGVDFRIRYREVGEVNWHDFETGAIAADGHLYDLDGFAKRKPFRMTFRRTVTRGQYEVAVKRVIPDDPGPKGKNAFHWTKLRSFTFDPPVLDDNLAITAVRIEAGDQLNGVVDLFNGLVKRIAPIWDTGSETFGAAAATRNPAELFRWVATGPAAPKPRTSGQVDDAALGAWAELCTTRGWKCDLEIRAGMGMDEVLETVARCGRAFPVERNGKLSVVVDDVQAAAVQMFTPRNSWGFRSSRRFPAATHALRCRFNNQEKGYVPDEMVVYYPGFDVNSAEILRTVPMVGKTDPLEVYRSAKRIIGEELLRPESYSWRCDWEHLVLQRGKRVAIAHPVIAVGRQAARVKAVTLNGPLTHVVSLTLDETVTQTPGDTYGLRWRRVSGSSISVETIALTNMGNGAGNVVTLASAIPVASAPTEGDLVEFGDATIETLDAILINVAPATDLEAEVTAVPYADALFAGDSEDLPAWSSNVTGEAFPRPPAPRILGVSSDSTGIYVAFDFTIAEASRVQAVEAYWKQNIDADAAYELKATLPRETRVAAFPPGELGVEYSIKLVAIGRAGTATLRTASDEVLITGGDVGSALIGFLTNESHTVATDSAGAGGDYSDAGGAFKVFRGHLDVSDGSDPDIGTTYEVVAGSETGGLSIAIDPESGVYAVAGLTADHGQATLRATHGAASVDRVYSISKSKAGVAGAPGDDGADAQTIRLTATSQQFTFDPENNANPASQTITFTVNRQNAPGGTVSWSTSPTVTLTGTGDTRQLTVANFGANTSVEVTATLGSLSDKITIVRTRAGGNLYTLTRSSNISLTGRALRKESGTSAFNAQAHSNESYVGGAFCSARPNQTNAAIAFGLTTDPTADAAQNSIDFAWLLNTNGTLDIIENGSLTELGGGETYTTSTVLSVHYDGVNVRYLKNGVVKRTVSPGTANLALFFDSSFNTVNGQLNDVAFGPSGSAATKEEARYQRAWAPPATPTGLAPAGWSLTPPDGSETLWRTAATLSADGTVLIENWGTPVLVSRGVTRAYSGAETYYRFNWVTFNGGTYECKVASTVGNAPSGTAEENAQWAVIAAPGPPGEPGDPPSGFTATIDIPSSTSGVNLRELASAAGYTGLSDATITFEVESGINVTGLAGAPNGGTAIDSGTWPSDLYTIQLTLLVKNGGIVRGGGGKGGDANSGNGGDGGDAIYLRENFSGGITFNSGSEIRGGGAGGGAGARGRQNVGGEIVLHGGGGGGGGKPNGPGGSGSTLGAGGDGANGTAGTTSAVGTGGAGGDVVAGDGGNGGDWASAGTVGQSGTTPLQAGGAPGAGGFAIRKNGFTATVTNNGATVSGTIG